MDSHYFWLFIITTGLTILSPGASALLVVSKTASMNFRGLWVIIGFNLAIALYFLLSSLGLTAIIATSQTAFLIIKWIGVGYLAYLGLSAILSRSGGIQVNKSAQKIQSKFALGSQGFMVEISNPKAWFYFAALLPSFTDLSRPLLPQFLIMTIISIVMQWLIYGGYGIMAIQITKGALKSSFVTWLNRIIGGVLLFTAYKMARLSMEKLP